MEEVQQQQMLNIVRRKTSSDLSKVTRLEIIANANALLTPKKRKFENGALETLSIKFKVSKASVQ